MAPARPPPWRELCRVKQHSVGSVSPHAWQLPVLLNLWLTVLATLLVTAIYMRHGNTSLGIFTAAVLSVLVCPLSLVWVKLAAQHCTASSDNQRKPPSQLPSLATITNHLPPPLKSSFKCCGVLFNQRSQTAIIVLCPSGKDSSCYRFIKTVVCVLVILRVLFFLLLLAGDVERNPGPTIVSANGLQFLWKMLEEESGNCYILFKELGIPPNVLEDLKSKYIHHFLLDCLCEWYLSDGINTFENIIDVLNGSVVPNKRLARRIEEFFRGHQRYSSGRLTGSVYTPYVFTFEENWLTFRDFKDLVELLGQLEQNWEIIASKLGVSPVRLKDAHRDPKRCLIEVIKMWLKGVDPEPTSATLATALKAIDEPEMASKIETWVPADDPSEHLLCEVRDLKELFEVSCQACEKWYYIGVYLGVDPCSMDEVEARALTPKRCLLEVLNMWLNGNGICSCWKNLAAAMRSNTVGEPEVAKKIKEFMLVPATKEDHMEGLPSMQDVLDVLAPVRDKWMLIGLQFDIHTSTLKKIKYSCRSDTTLCLSETMQILMESDRNVWAELALALRSSAVREPEMAQKIEEEYGTLRKVKWLSQKNVKEITNLLAPVVDKWRFIGLQFNLEYNIVEIVDCDYEHPMECLLQVITMWLIQDCSPTWAKLAKVLRSKSVVEPDCADEIEKKHGKFALPLPRDNKQEVAVYRVLTHTGSGSITMKLKEGRELGRGSYGYAKVMKDVDSGKEYAGKFFFPGYTWSGTFASKFEKEAKILSELKHNNIVQYQMSVSSQDSNQYCILMELMECSIRNYFFTKTTRTVYIKLSVLLDTARGLSYLHSCSPTIIHRDLTASNVLLTADDPPVAKIADFGNSRVIDFESSSQALYMTKVPGTMAYMAPEACKDDARYNTKLDIFSFGHLSLCVLIQKECNNGEMYPRSVSQQDGRKLLYSEADRRKSLMCGLDHGHCVDTMIRDCLKNEPDNRPKADALVSRLDKMVDATDSGGEEALKTLTFESSEVSSPDMSDQSMASGSDPFGIR